jgi:hypothetical protein
MNNLWLSVSGVDKLTRGDTVMCKCRPRARCMDTLITRDLRPEVLCPIEVGDSEHLALVLNVLNNQHSVVKPGLDSEVFYHIELYV